MQPDSEYLKIRALYKRFIASLPPDDGKIRSLDEYSPEFHETTKELAREHISHIGYMVYCIERLYGQLGVEIEPPDVVKE